MTTLEQRARDALDEWYNGLAPYLNNLPSKGSIGAALHVLGRLREEFSLDVGAHVADGQAQIKGLSASSLRKLLAGFGETRKLSEIGGRSNRGARGDVASLFELLRPLYLQNEPDERRNAILHSLQLQIVREYVPLFFSAKRVKAAFDRNSSTWQFIHALLLNAKQNGKGGAVAEHLVGAKLALKFPNKTIRNKPSSAADLQGGFVGDFEIGKHSFPCDSCSHARTF